MAKRVFWILRPTLPDPPTLSCWLSGWDGADRGGREGKEWGGGRTKGDSGDRGCGEPGRGEEVVPPTSGSLLSPRISARHVMIMGFQLSRSLRGSVGWDLGLGLEALVSHIPVMVQVSGAA